MSNDYNPLSGQIPFPPVRTIVAYAELIRTHDERRRIASRLATAHAKLRREKTAERWIVLTVALMLAITMLPVLLLIGAIALARKCGASLPQARNGSEDLLRLSTRGSEAVSVRVTN